ncbi:MAG: chemotaxis protein CheA [Pyrinomonadaceae bacterium]
MDQSERLFLAELEERVEHVFAAIDQLRTKPDDGKARRQIILSIFRHVHSIKGSAAAAGLDHLAQLAHEFESLLDAVRVGHVSLTESVLQVFEEAAEAMLRAVAPAISLADPTEQLFDRIHRLSTQSAVKTVDVQSFAAAVPGEIWELLNREEKHRLAESVSEGANVYLITTKFDITLFDRLYQQLTDHLNERGEVISIAPQVETTGDSPKINFRILYATRATLHQLKTNVGTFSGVEVTQTFESKLRGVGEAVTSTITHPPSATPTSVIHPYSSKIIHIELDEVDHLISATHRLLRENQSNLDESNGSVSKSELTQALLDLAADIINLRMVSLDRVLQRAVRGGRAAARATAKEVEFLVTGSELLVDKALADAIADPLIHLVRNAVDHGIERPEERVQNGKERTGKIRITASMRQGQTRISVSDDGRGVDTSAVSQAARRAGVVKENVDLSLDQCLRMIFRPGFSTASSVSTVSGRGVGLDEVETKIEQLGGDVRVRSVPGVGSSFETRLPVTFSLVDVIPVSVGFQQYLIDKHQVVEPLLRTADEIDAGGRRFRFKEEWIPLFYLRRLLSEQALPDSEQPSTLVCEISSEETDVERIAIAVDAVGGPQQVLVRNLGSRGGHWFGIAGAAELGDGRVVLLLDLARLFAENFASPVRR